MKAEHRASLPGLVHGSVGERRDACIWSRWSTVEINNDIVALEAAGARRDLSHSQGVDRSRSARNRRNWRQALESATELDVIQAKARPPQITGVAPPIAADGRLELRAARHPLLIPGVVARLPDDPAARPDGADAGRILVVPPATVLLVTGPNTGGKTVALKTAGPLALMAQAGL